MAVGIVTVVPEVEGVAVVVVVDTVVDGAVVDIVVVLVVATLGVTGTF